MHFLPQLHESFQPVTHILGEYIGRTHEQGTERKLNKNRILINPKMNS